MAEQTVACARCQAGQFDLCISPVEIEGEPGMFAPCGWATLDKDDATPRVSRERTGGAVRDPDELSNDVSAGRKRAAMLAPIMRGMRCEWAGLKFAGGGVIPIMGCKGNTIAMVKTKEEAAEAGVDKPGHRHHGPDKAVLNNAVGVNLHRICADCHNRWHALNDPYYEKDRTNVSEPYLPLEPYYGHDDFTVFTGEERAIVEEWWATPKAQRGPYPFTPEARKFEPLAQRPTTPVVLDATEDPFA